MIVLNFTTLVPWHVVDEWLLWQREEHIPEILSTQLFDDYKLFRLMDAEDHEGPTFVIQYFTSTKDRYRRYLDEFALSLRQKALARWRNQVIAYRTAMELVN